MSWPPLPRNVSEVPAPADDSGFDIILGFDATGNALILDTLQVSQAEFGFAALDILNVTSGGATATTAADQFVFDKGASALYFDADGAAGADGIKIAELVGITIDLVAGNFSVVA